MPTKARQHIAYIETLFQQVQLRFFSSNNWKEHLDYLDSAEPQFKSIAFESASVEVAVKDISQNLDDLPNWKKFKEYAGEIHQYHVAIGLGWAYAKCKRLPSSFSVFENSIFAIMTFDGMGYFNSLYRQKKTMDRLSLPEGFDAEMMSAYDQGIGRRIWYQAKADPQEALKLSLRFPKERRAAIWRGIGLACGYVGGNERDDLKLLARLSKEHIDPLREGIALAAEIRYLSQDDLSDIEQACHTICETSLQDIISKQIPS